MLKVYNTLTKQIENFKPIDKNKVSIYVCGPTVYSDIHIGNARPVIFFDVVKRYLKFIGYEVYFVSNITDVDDKIIEKAKELKIKEIDLTKKYTNHFLEMVSALGSYLPDHLPKATEYVFQMIEYILELIKKGYAYQTSKGVYFRVSRISDYGILSNQNLDELNQGVRILLDDEKEDPRDFSIWKITDEGLSYDSPFGIGRPGWHTECAVMNKEIFGKEIDIHGGGSDLKFPHHENEIAQTFAIDHHHLAKYWMHVGRLDLNDTKMSKSLGNIVLVKDLILDYEPFAFRLLIISHHYRQQINYSEDLMIQFSKEYDKIKRSLKKAFLVISLAKSFTKDIDLNYMDQFRTLMNDDFNTPNVVTLIYDILKQMNKESDSMKLAVLYQTIKTILEVLGIMPLYELTDETLLTYRNWEQARNDKDYARADYLRSELSSKGWI